MKKIVVMVVGVFLISTLIGCKKKNSEEAVLDNMTSGVVSENVVSVGDAANNSVPVIVENAEALPQSSGDMAAGIQAVSEKPTPKQIQQALKNAGFYKGKIEGTLGPKTKKAIEDFQSQNGFKADGKVGAKTWKALSSHLTQTTEVANPSAEPQTTGQ